MNNLGLFTTTTIAHTVSDSGIYSRQLKLFEINKLSAKFKFMATRWR
nr:unnamed protein product [Moritella viscosa]SHO17909.1 unnamed protein product [Moritella viscosa]